jgi:hypothetical protein
MATATEQTELRPELISKLRELARRGTSVRELVGTIHETLDCGDDAAIPALAYIAHAFCLPLIEVLPIREWLGTDHDKEIDALILPAIRRTGSQWGREDAS